MNSTASRTKLFADEAEAREFVRACDLGWVGSHLRYSDETDSTNARARELGRPAGTLVLAEYQTRGRGRLGRRWVCPARAGLLLSVLVDRSHMMTPKGGVALQWLTAAGALAMARAASDASLPSCGQADVLIEWPNDLVAVEGSRGEDGGPSPDEGGGAVRQAHDAPVLSLSKGGGAIRTLGGVLVEGHHDAGLLVMGVGLNVDTRADEVPPEVAGGAGSLLTAFGATPDRRDILRGFLRELEARLANVKGLPAELRDRSATIGREVTVELDGRPRRARATGFDEGMRLVVELPGGRVAAVASAGLVEASVYPAVGPAGGGGTA